MVECVWPLRTVGDPRESRENTGASEVMEKGNGGFVFSNRPQTSRRTAPPESGRPGLGRFAAATTTTTTTNSYYYYEHNNNMINDNANNQ